MLLQIIGIVEIKGNNKNIEKITADSHYDILAFFSCIDRKFFSAPRAYLLTVRFLHGAEIAGTAAILFLIHTQRLPAAFTPQGLFLQGWICFPIVRPPLDTAGVAAETALCAGAPFRLHSSDRSERAADNTPAAFPAISYNGTAAGSVFHRNAASARLHRSA